MTCCSAPKLTQPVHRRGVAIRCRFLEEVFRSGDILFGSDALHLQLGHSEESVPAPHGCCLSEKTIGFGRVAADQLRRALA